MTRGVQVSGDGEDEQDKGKERGDGMNDEQRGQRTAGTGRQGELSILVAVELTGYKK